MFRWPTVYQLNLGREWAPQNNTNCCEWRTTIDMSPMRLIPCTKWHVLAEQAECDGAEKPAQEVTTLPATSTELPSGRLQDGLVYPFGRCIKRKLHISLNVTELFVDNSESTGVRASHFRSKHLTSVLRC
ncbi:hypothetical protein L226DRAFT_254989 [Lentinus tigrinus ALCF2SS1-7]|uniref:uncharacterized protein n=1 Tax=Lentinus tigrinus ALCF2SS1-7 TaxID=1328758 RepID=UPI0011661244|nr:hypothetical protein L226DRAFT_254989 [Lentinus tigrinus ALCF2SS1-7]